ncbi:SufS family cysteine desulfurase [Amycolatopsis rubida]|uniref:Cysteine desulfurase n=3 Tax=Amycolatopsis TaxID=1813 RepID=A0ABX0BUT2_9PSEU|nr:SufS family cysteine desulfurase [Amycolatopsis rubida]NEC57989.1 SufS family cysteine desulfurase [Amycolatopsis rubida]
MTIAAEPACECAAHGVAVPAAAGPGGPGYDVDRVRADFPILARKVNGGRPLVYLDSAATSQKPRAVLEAESDYYRLHNANVHRSYHELGREATELLEGGRRRIAGFVGAAPEDVVLTKNASEALNLVAYALGNASWAEPELRSLALGPGDRVVVTEMEHHSNLMPWQQLCRQTGAELAWLTITPDGRLDLGDLAEVVNERTKVFAFTHQSNVYGTVNPVGTLVARAREVGALTVLDACQSVPHMPVDVAALGVDFLAFSGHKMCGPTGVGVLWGRRDLLRTLPPFQTGGEMNDQVAMDSSTYAQPPYRFEAGTPVIAQTVGLAAACDYLGGLGRQNIAAHCANLTARALDALASIPGVRIVGPATTQDRGAAISFSLADRFPDEIGAHLDKRGIAIRVGHLCARPACVRFGLPATTRVSFYVYNTEREVDLFAEALAELAEPAIHALPAPKPAARPDAPAMPFLDRVFGDAATAITGVAVSVGDRLGLYRAMAGTGPLTAAELAARTGTRENYLAEWLHTQVGAGYVHSETSAGERTYVLPDEHAAVLADPDAPGAGIGVFAAVQALYRVEDQLAGCLRDGGGVDWGDYPPEMFRAIARFFRPAYNANIVSSWLPALDGVTERLAAGGRVADIGCGIGHSTLLMAAAHPHAAFDGYDYHQPSVDHARIVADERGLADRARFHTAAAADLRPPPGGGYDLVTFFNCLHDMGDPLAALRAARGIVSPDGVVMLVEPNAEADPATNTHPIGRLFMALSFTLCLPAAAAQDGPLALGNHAGEAELRGLAEQAGFTRWRRVAETPRSAVYELRP